jgi:predicted glycosyltransferase
MTISKQNLPRLDLLLYAHDGRGLGHVARMVAIGVAVRRLHTELRVLLVTGCRQTGELIGPAPLDWLKLPAYATKVVAGKSRGVDGLSGFSDQVLGQIRADQILHIVEHYRPRLVLSDHTPQGKHKELVPSLEASGQIDDIKWLLGMRGVIGSVEQTESTPARDLFRRFYSGLLWYGDAAILGDDHKKMLAKRFEITPVECGYVSRLSELSHFLPTHNGTYACTVSVPWFDEHTHDFLDQLVKSIQQLGGEYGQWRIFLGEGADPSHVSILNNLTCCAVEPFSTHYLQASSSSKMVIVFGGYNSLVDVLSLNIPAIVVMRSMQDMEQQHHLEKLTLAIPEKLTVIEEQKCSTTLLYEKILIYLQNSFSSSLCGAVNLSGAENAAHHIAALLP